MPAIAADEVPTLTAADRCDACGAQAYVEVAFNTGTLLFCAHHFASSTSVAMTTGIVLTDEREVLYRQVAR